MLQIPRTPQKKLANDVMSEPPEEYQYKEKLDLKNLNPNAVELHKVICPSCCDPVSADNLNIESNIAKCNNCDGIFSFESQVERLTLRDDITQELLQPEGVQLSYFHTELDIAVEQPWSGSEIGLVTMFPFFIFMLLGIIIETISLIPFAKAIAIAILVTSFVGYITYFFRRKRHKLYVHIDNHNLYIERRPKKFIKDKMYAIQHIDQIYIKNGTSGNSVHMIVNGPQGQKHIQLIQSVNSRTKAKYIEQEIERHLGIKDRRVPDEDA